jgi:two-component system sensor kinase FixL
MNQSHEQFVDATRQLQDRLMHVSRFAAVGEMAAGLAHELNQPLAAVANYAQACERLLAAPNPDLHEVRDALRQITAQAVRAGDIISRMRGLTRARESSRELCHVNALVREIADLLESDARAHAARCRFRLADDLPALLLDRAQIQQVILALVRNALEALQECPPENREVVVSTARSADGNVRIEVCDNGPGIATTIAARLFEPFCTTKTTGTGLGLASSRTIAREHRGTLEYQPQKPGTCFRLCLPAAEQHCV